MLYLHLNSIQLTSETIQKESETSMSSIITDVLMILWSVAYFCEIEYHLHKYIMHRPLPIPFTQWVFDYPFKAHALVHHRIFKADQTYHLINESDAKTIPMAIWNGIVLVTLGTLPLALVGWFMGYAKMVSITVFIVGAVYYGTYEYIHWCMHKPLQKKRPFQRFPITGPIFYRLNGHHILHHLYPHKNFNVVCPLGDKLHGTLIKRAKRYFKQPHGLMVPDLQPLELPPARISAAIA
jgi:hypothetical protein